MSRIYVVNIVSSNGQSLVTSGHLETNANWNLSIFSLEMHLEMLAIAVRRHCANMPSITADLLQEGNIRDHLSGRR